MSKDYLERKSYRKSPGRQYGADFDPLRGRNRSDRLNTTTTSGRLSSRAEITEARPSRPSVVLAQRPDPRRTRQLMRQSILASKSHATTYEEETEQPVDDMQYVHDMMQEEQPEFAAYERSTQIRQRSPLRTRRIQQEYEPEYEDEMGWEDDGFVDPDGGVDFEDEDPLDRRLGYAARPSNKLVPPPVQSRRGAYVPDEEYEEDYYEEEEEEPRPARKARKKKGGVSRRKMLFGVLGVAVGGTAAYEVVHELAPQLPGAIQNVGTNIEKQIEDAYNKGLAAGAEAVRKEFINSLDNLEGVSLDAAIGAAKLTRVAYDTFVSPLVTLAATVAGDFLNVTLRALITGRHWLANIGQDNPTALGGLQTVLETWVKNVTEMPKQIQSITDADLSGAQAYLHALQNKIKDEQAKLNNPTPIPTAKPTTKPKS